MKKDTNSQIYALLFVLALLVNLSGIGLKFFTDDPALYASIAKNLIYKKDFLQLFTYNQDWLDKPHFPFWAAMCSFKLFGISEWAYRLPALLFFLLGGLYTYLFTKKFYSHETAMIAVLILLTAQSAIMSNVDVRAEPYLMGLVMGSIYHIAHLNERYNFTQLLLAALLTACAIMTKGLFVIVAIYGALLGQLLFQKNFKSVFSFKWLFLGLLTLLFILPECYALYVQFDLHPEKVVFGQKGVSGIKWFLWDSQFGRFVSSGPITRSSSDVFFFVHTLLWAFAPWCLLFYFSIYKNFKQIFQKKKLAEYYTMSGGLLLLFIFSISRFQLPFYTNTLFPLFAIITAPYITLQLNKAENNIRLTGLWLYIALLPVAVLLIHFFSKPDTQLWFIIDCVVTIVIIVLIVTRVKENYKRAFMLASSIALFVNFYLNSTFYGELINYKGQISAADYANQQQLSNYKLFSLRMENNQFQFYCNRPVDYIPLEQFDKVQTPATSLFYVSQPSMDELVRNKAQFNVVASFTDYPQENILPAFINSATRNKVLGKVYLISKK